MQPLTKSQPKIDNQKSKKWTHDVLQHEAYKNSSKMADKTWYVHDFHLDARYL